MNDRKNPEYVLAVGDKIRVQLVTPDGRITLPVVRLTEGTNLTGKRIGDTPAMLLDLFRNSPWTATAVVVDAQPAVIMAAQSATDNDTYDPSKLDQMPGVKSQSRPNYPFEMRRKNVQGEVVVDFIVDTNGDVRKAYAFSSTRSEFEDAAIEAVSKWKFKPGRKDGRDVNTHMRVPIIFSLSNQ